MKWTENEVAELERAYRSAPSADLLDLATLAKRLGRDKANVCRKARQLGLTKQDRPKVAQPALKEGPKFANKEERAAATSAWVKAAIAKNGHPRGALGLKHSPEAKKAMRDATVRAWANPNSRFNSESFKQAASDRLLIKIAEGKMNSAYSRARGGKREDLGNRYFRSAWEANYARYLNLLVSKGEITSWDYECKTFIFEHIKRGTRSYTPDFKINKLDGTYEWHEVKGWMDQASRTRLARMERCFPAERVVVVGADWFRSANKTLPGLIAGWEGGTTR